MRCLLYITLSLLINSTPCLAIEKNRITTAAAYLQAIEMDLDMAGSERKTRIYTLGFSFRERLSQSLDGAILFGYLDVSQRTNPVSVAQNSSGGYLGLDLRGHLINTDKFDLFSRLDYRYAETASKLAGQKVDWKWHQLNLSLDSQIYISEAVYANISISYLGLDGEEKLSGDLNQRLDFDQIDSLTAHIGLQLNLDHNGQIAIELLTGSQQGGKLIFIVNF